MNRKILSLNLALLALTVLLGWQIRQRWIQAKAAEKAVLERIAREQALLIPPPPAPVPPVAPGEYLGTVQNMLFSKDRNPNVIVDPPPPPPPAPKPPPMPALPHYFGQIRFGGPPVVILGSGGSDQKGYSAGEKVGDFKVVSFDRESITLEWNSQSVVRHLDDLKPKEASAPAPAGPPPTAGMGINPPGVQPPLQQAQTRSITSIGGSSDSSTSSDAAPQFGALLPNGNYNCKPEDATPIGTVNNGFKKSTYYSMMGPTCTWEPVKKQ